MMIVPHASTSVEGVVNKVLQQNKFSPSQVIVFEMDAKKSLDEVRSESLGKVITTEQGQSFEVTAVGEFTSIIKSKTADLRFLMSGERPFERIHKDAEASFLEITAKGCAAGRRIWLFKLEMVPWVFDPDNDA